MLIFSLISINYSINQHHCMHTNPLVWFLLLHCPFCCYPTCQTLSISVYKSPSTIFRSFLICSCSSGHPWISSLAPSPCLALLSRNCLISSSASSESPAPYLAPLQSPLHCHHTMNPVGKVSQKVPTVPGFQWWSTQLCTRWHDG